MTKIRNPLSIENVLSNMISKLNEDEVKNLTNKSISHFRKCSDPDDKDHNLYLSDAIKLDIIMQRNSLGTPLMDNFQIMLDEEFKKVEVIVPDDQLSLAIGRKGQNVRLASHVSKWEISILTEGDESDRRQKETKKETQELIEALVIDEVIAHLLVSEGFKKVDPNLEDVYFITLKENS